jgi:hypothetical protein
MQLRTPFVVAVTLALAGAAGALLPGGSDAAGRALETLFRVLGVA